jgi:hypothetical protein
MQLDERVCKKLKTIAKPFLFDLSPHYLGTEGDRKPLFILAILAARSTPVTILLERKKRDSCMTKFAEYLGVLSNITFLDFKDVCPAGLPFEEYRQHFKDLRSKYFSIAAGSPSWMSSNKCDLILDFGDNNGPNRFVTKLLTSEDSQSVSFTSLCLPMDECPMWSNESDVLRLKDFCAARRIENRKIMLLAGSMCPTFDFKEIFQWVFSHKDWSFIIIGQLDRMIPRYFASKELMTKYLHTPNDSVLHFESIQYEDVLRFVDFSVSNGGAGSIFASLACGVPQSVAFSLPIQDMQGSDKNSNCLLLQNLKVGPKTTREKQVYNRNRPSMILNFDSFMKDVNENLSMYAANAVTYKEICKQEYKAFDQVCDDAFKVLGSCQGQLNCRKKLEEEPEIDIDDLLKAQRKFGIFPKS